MTFIICSSGRRSKNLGGQEGFAYSFSKMTTGPTGSKIQKASCPDNIFSKRITLTHASMKEFRTENTKESVI
jgi:hypothetical protein